MSDKQPPPIINVQYITQEAKKSGWPLWFVAVIGFALFGATTQTIKFGGGRRAQAANPYTVIPADGSQTLPTYQPAGLLAEPQAQGAQQRYA